MDRETKTQKTKSGLSFEFKTYLTRGERRALQQVLFKDMPEMKVDPEKSEEELEITLTPSVMIEYEPIMVKNIVVKIGDGAADVWTAYENLREDDADEILSAISEVAQQVAKKKTKKT